jgi:predicted  nucleic acid-binding Zn-ribbon protein
MSFLAPLLEVQELDVAADAARRRSEELPEREAIPALAGKLREIEAGLATATAERSEKETEEVQIASEVTQVARDIETAEVERYSGKRKNQDEAADHDASQQRLRERQSELEEREMALLEEIEAVDERIAQAEAARSANSAESERVGELVRKVEADVVVETARLGEEREKILGKVPAAVLATYERVRSQPQKGGRGAALLEVGRCGGCRIKLPSLEKTRMMAEPEDTVIQCPQCRRVLVR